MTQRAIELVVGVFANATGVQHHHIGIVIAFGAQHAIGLKKPCNAFGVVFVHLAPKGAHNVRTGLLLTHRTEATDTPRGEPPETTRTGPHVLESGPRSSGNSVVKKKKEEVASRARWARCRQRRILLLPLLLRSDQPERESFVPYQP